MAQFKIDISKINLKKCGVYDADDWVGQDSLVINSIGLLLDSL